MLALGFVLWRVLTRRWRREAFIRTYRFPRSLFNAFRETHPQLDDKDAFLVSRALRAFFLVHLRTRPRSIGMPSRIVDDLWHAFILDTRAYEAFCRQAFGGLLHHVPAAKMEPGISSDDAMRLTWRHACREENIDWKRPSRLPLLFAIDAKLHIPNGNVWRLEAPVRVDGRSDGSCGGFACSGDGLAGGARGGGDSDGDSGGGSDGCGGGGGD